MEEKIRLAVFGQKRLSREGGVDEYKEARASTLNAFYTSPTVIKAMYEGKV